MPLEIERKRIEPDIAVLELRGRISFGAESQSLQDLVVSLCEENVRKLVIDLGSVSHVDSAGLAVLAFCAGVMQNSGGALRLVRPGARVAKLLRITCLDTLLPVDANAEEASHKFPVNQPA